MKTRPVSSAAPCLRRVISFARFPRQEVLLTCTSEAWRAPLAERSDCRLAVHTRGHGAAGTGVLRLAQQAVLVLRDHSQRGLFFPVLMRGFWLHELRDYVPM